MVGKRKGSHAQKYSIPGGSLGLGETFEKGAIREIKEETNLDICVLYAIAPLIQPHVIKASYMTMITWTKQLFGTKSFPVAFNKKTKNIRHKFLIRSKFKFSFSSYIF